MDSAKQAAAEQQIAMLERAAMDAHKEAQSLNKQQRFEEAKIKYDEMRRLDAQALELANSIGCPSCRTTPVASADSAAAPDATALEYAGLQLVTPWPTTGAAGRALGAVLGSAVADAAAMGVQWIYDVTRLQALLQERRAKEGLSEKQAGLEFMDPPQSPFLPGYSTGRNSPYGEEALALLRSLARNGGLDCHSYAGLYAETFGEGFDGYRNASTTGFLRNHSRGQTPPASGAEDAQADCVARLAPLVAAFAGHPRLMRLVAAATRTTQNTDDAEAWACAGAAVLERLLLGDESATLADAVAETVQELRSGSDRLPSSDLNLKIAGHFLEALELRTTAHPEVVEKLGRNCHMPNAAATPLHAALHHEWLMRNGGGGGGDAVFAAAIRDAMAAGGCCASRAAFAGACLGALLGPGAVPASWAAKYDLDGEVRELCEAINRVRGG